MWMVHSRISSMKTLQLYFVRICKHTYLHYACTQTYHGGHGKNMLPPTCAYILCVCVCVCVRVRVHVYVCVHVYVHVCVHMCVSVYMHTYVTSKNCRKLSYKHDLQTKKKVGMAEDPLVLRI